MTAGRKAAGGSVRVLIVDDQHMIREAIRSLLEAAFDFEVIEADSSDQALSVLATMTPDVVLLDVAMPGVGGIEGLHEIRKVAPDVPVVMLSSYDNMADVRESLDAGASGYIVKSATSHQLKEAIDGALSGEGVYLHPLVTKHMLVSQAGAHGARLSERELIVLAALSDGATNDQIAAALLVSKKTVKSQLSSVFRKLGVANRTEAIATAIREGILPSSRHAVPHEPDKSNQS